MTETARTALATRRGILPATLAGAVVGAVAGVLTDQRTSHADPVLALAIGGGIGAVLGRSAWIRVGVAHIYGINPVAMVSILLGRILGCVLLGIGIIATLSREPAATRLAAMPPMPTIVAGAVLLVVTAVIEQRWLRRRDRRHDVGARADAASSDPRHS